MNILALCGASKGALVPSLAIGVPAGMRADGLDGFAIGALMSGACFLMATSPRRPRRGGRSAPGASALSPPRARTAARPAGPGPAVREPRCAGCSRGTRHRRSAWPAG
jgi:hypothetical protein